jgi:hypothetical protein
VWPDAWLLDLMTNCRVTEATASGNAEPALPGSGHNPAKNIRGVEHEKDNSY